MALKTALYVDFDNVFISLIERNIGADVVFARSPQKWLSWLEAGGVGDEKREILVRRVYLNPRHFGKYRHWFTRAGFQTVDCPSLTGHGKNAADILMVMDIMDALNHPTHFDEFIILSADSDFTPVLLRLREHGRQTAVYSTELTAIALKGSATSVLHDFDFIEQALGVEDPNRAAREEMAEAQAEARVERDPAEELGVVATAVARHVQNATAPVPLATLPHVIRGAYPPFLGSNWLGYQSLRGLVDAIVSVQPGIAVRSQGVDVWLEPAAASPAADATADDANAAPFEGMDDDTLRARILDYIADQLDRSPQPLHGAVLGLNIPKIFGAYVRDSNWLGAGTLTQLIRAGNRSDIDSSGHYILNPQKHTLPEDARTSPTSTLAGLPDDLAEFVEDAAAFGWPRIGPVQIDQVICEAVQQIRQGLTYVPELSVRVRDALRDAVDRGELPPDRFVSRANINQLLNSLVRANINLATRCTTEDDMRRELYQSLLDLVAYNMSIPFEAATPMADMLMGYAPMAEAAPDEPAAGAAVSANAPIAPEPKFTPQPPVPGEAEAQTDEWESPAPSKPPTLPPVEPRASGDDAGRPQWRRRPWWARGGD